jgi:ubiquinone/menaquinone biosynthesis C-methylase UbiE
MRTERLPLDQENHLEQLRNFYDKYAEKVTYWHERNAGYHKAIADLSSFYIPSGARVLEVGSGNGDLIAALNPSYGVGIDVSNEMVQLAARRYPHIQFLHTAAEKLDLPGERFDYVILSDLIGYLYDIRLFFERLRTVCHSRTRLVFHWYSRFWEPILSGLVKLGLKHPQPIVNWTSVEDMYNLLYLSDFEVISYHSHLLVPIQIPVLSRFINRFLAHLPVFRMFCLTNWIIARPIGLPVENPAPVVSIVTPCRNEAGNIEQIVNRIPWTAGNTELILVEGHSSDNTWEECQRVAEQSSNRDIRVFKQNGKGKGDAVQLGFAQARGDILIILDADLSVSPEELPQFYDALLSGKGEMINGSRLVYAMDPKAMRFLNLMGNKFFAHLLSLLIGQRIKDTLCGTKALWREDYLKIVANRSYFGDFDPFGDFDLLFGAARLNLKIVEVPIRYRERRYGETNISRFTHGWLLLKMSAYAATKLFFVA